MNHCLINQIFRTIYKSSDGMTAFSSTTFDSYFSFIVQHSTHTQTTQFLFGIDLGPGMDGICTVCHGVLCTMNECE